MRKNNVSWLQTGLFILAALLVACQFSFAQDQATDVATSDVKPHSDQLKSPVRLLADGKPIDIGEHSPLAHAGPSIADVDNDGDRDLLVGDFPGYFWFFENTGTDKKPVYEFKGNLEAGGEKAKTPVY